MSGRQTTVKAIEALKAIRSGMSDADLMEKFNLSAAALQSVFAQLAQAGILQESEIQARTSSDVGSVILGVGKDKFLPEAKKKPVIDAAEALGFIRAGMDDASIMKHFDISAKGLQSLINKLLSAGIIGRDELDQRPVRGAVPKAPEKPSGGPAQEDAAAESSDLLPAVADDVKSGVADRDLMEKYGLSADLLRETFDRLVSLDMLLPADLAERSLSEQPSVLLDVKSTAAPSAGQAKKPVIDAADALQCLRDGMDDATLMKRYDISARGLQSLFGKLVSSGVLSQTEIDDRATGSHSSVIVDEAVPEDSPVAELKERPDLGRIADEVRDGTSLDAIMEQHGLSSKALDGLLRELIEAGGLSEADLATGARRHSVMLEIRHKTTAKVIYRGVERSLGALVEKAVHELISLADSDLVGANLSRRDLSGAQMARVDLRKAILVGTDLTGADLSGAVLKSADLYGATIYKTNLAESDLSDANLTQANGPWAFMPGANLSEANLSNANLVGANLANANLFESILTGARLDGAYLVGAQLDYIRKSDPNG